MNLHVSYVAAESARNLMYGDCIVTMDHPPACAEDLVNLKREIGKTSNLDSKVVVILTWNILYERA